MRDSVTIVGASLAGLRSAETLRRDGFGGRISLIGDEPHQPYDRPPLSKQVLAGDWEPERALLTPAEKLEPLGLDLRLGVRATGLDVAARELEVDGVAEPFDGLLIATGARCRTLPGTGSPVGVHTLRTLDDCLAIRAALDDGARRMVVIGAGFIGAEVASVAVGRGTSVTLVEALPAPFARVLGQEMGAVVADVHVANGVDLRCGVGVSSVAGEPGAMTVAMADGSDVYADLVVVGIGVVPNTEWLEGSGLTLDDGVVCDPTCLAAPNVVAAGDVARWTDPRTGESMRVEHWDNAVEQGRHAVRRLLATDEEAEVFAPVPWFWSDQYDRKIQLAGRPHPDDEVRVVDGSTDERRFAAFYGRRGQLTAVLGMNRPRQVMQGRGLLEQGVGWDDALAVAAGWT
ncbi:MAG: NAD(P)/FAD-dependent oxidoreductase [Actinomycetia bacterium]|nr:NAD(P)/FAD-dependent oxidoreductase [Actinomycetes bacterium]